MIHVKRELEAYGEQGVLAFLSSSYRSTKKLPAHQVSSVCKLPAVPTSKLNYK